MALTVQKFVEKWLTSRVFSPVPSCEQEVHDEMKADLEEMMANSKAEGYQRCRLDSILAKEGGL